MEGSGTVSKKWRDLKPHENRSNVRKIYFILLIQTFENRKTVNTHTLSVSLSSHHTILSSQIAADKIL